MEILTAICVISFIGILLVLIWIMRKMEKIKRQINRIYEDKPEENRLTLCTGNGPIDKCKRIAEKTDKHLWKKDLKDLDDLAKKLQLEDE